MQPFSKFPTSPQDPDLHFYYEAAQKNPNYPVAAYCYLAKCLKRLLDRVAKEKGEKIPHVNGKDVCHAMKDSLRKQYGMLALDVLSEWNIKETNDFGNIVYTLIDVGLLSSSPHDSRTDFVKVFLFNWAFSFKSENEDSAPWENLE